MVADVGVMLAAEDEAEAVAEDRFRVEDVVRVKFDRVVVKRLADEKQGEGEEGGGKWQTRKM